MTYNPDKQYRCAIIRGRAKADIDNLLSIYAQILQSVCPCKSEYFEEQFNSHLAQYLPGSEQKTLSNHRTEIVGRLFGMYYQDVFWTIHLGERTKKLLADNDQPAFFKDICYKMQFPTGMSKSGHLKEHLDKKIWIRQVSYLLRLLLLAKDAGKKLDTEELGYYVLNCLPVLQGKVNPSVVLETIVGRRKSGVVKTIHTVGKAFSFTHQHIREQFNYMELANLVRQEGNHLVINEAEAASVEFIAAQWNKALLFSFDNYDFSDSDSLRELDLNWQSYYSRTADEADIIFKTQVESLSQAAALAGGHKTDDVADEGETFVYHREKERVKKYNPRLCRKVLYLAKTKGLGFDIQSVVAEDGPNAEHAIYIEVKTTKRVTKPSGKLTDTVTLTRNEWVAAEQHRSAYSIYRVYFTQEGVRVFAINDPATKSENKQIFAVPLQYRVDFNQDAGTFTYV